MLQLSFVQTTFVLSTERFVVKKINSKDCFTAENNYQKKSF